MKKLYCLIGLMAMICMISTGMLQATDLYVGGTGTPNYATIELAISAANPLGGDTVIVAAGTYPLTAPIVVDRPVTIKGAMWNVDPRPSVGGRSGSESILTSSFTFFDIRANNVEINGFKIESSINSASKNVVQVDYSSNYYNNIKILYNIIYNTAPITSGCNEAIKIRRSNADALVSYNYIFNHPSPGDAINFDRVTNGVISYNEVINNGSENAAIYVYDSVSTSILGNIVDTTTVNEGIKLGNKSGGNAGQVGGLIIGNITRNTKQDGIAIYMGDTIVKWNEVSGSTSENGAIYVAWAVSRVTIRENDVHDNTLKTSSWGGAAAGIMIGTAVSAGTVYVNYNNIYSNTPYGVTNKAVAQLDAKYNWWGAGTGPGTSGADLVSTNVNYSPWLPVPRLPIAVFASQSIASSTGSGEVILTSNPGVIVNPTAISEGSLPTLGKPAGSTFPHGLFSFLIGDIASGASVTMTFILPSAVPADAQYWKYNEGSGWNQIPITSISGNTFTIQLTDGVLGNDADLVANGLIVDPGGVAVFNKPPVANAGLDQTVEQTSPAGALITLSGSGSTDPDSDPLTYAWTWSGGGSATGVSPTVTLPSGTTVVTLVVNDGKVDSAPDTVNITVQDTKPPSTTATLVGTEGLNGWYVSNVTVSLNATDAGSGVKEIHYSINGGTEIVVAGVILLTAQGSTTVSYHALDKANNSEVAKTLTVKIAFSGPSFMIEEAKIDFKKKLDDDKVFVKGKFVVGGNVSFTDQIIISIGPYSETITSMEEKGKGKNVEYKRPKGEMGIKDMKIEWKDGEAKFEIHIDKLAELNWVNPVPIALQIGLYQGYEKITMDVKKDKWEYHDKK